MIRRLISRKLDSAESELGASLDYLRHILRISLPAFFKFTKIMPLANYRKLLPPGPYHVARLVATRDEDCGTCLQIEVHQARKAGLAPEHLRSAVAGRPEELPEELADVYCFTEAVVTASYTEGELRQRLRSRYGEEGLIELAYAIAACRIFPVTKRALGYATSCANVEIEV